MSINSTRAASMAERSARTAWIRSRAGEFAPGTPTHVPLKNAGTRPGEPGVRTIVIAGTALIFERGANRRYVRPFVQTAVDFGNQRTLSPDIFKDDAVSGGIGKMSNWKALYRNDLDQDRTSRSSPSKEAALGQARRLYIQERAEIYRIGGPDGLILPKEQIMRLVSGNRG